MNWSDISSAVGRAAPILGTLVGGPAGAAIGGLVAAALGASATPDAVQEAVERDPNAALKLAQLEADNRVKLQELVCQHAEALQADETRRILADVDDRKSARDREAAVRDSTPAALAWIIVGSSVALGAAVCAGVVSKDPVLAGTVGTVIGYVFGEAKQVLSYYFGSTSGSARKTELLAKTTPAAEPNAATG